MPKLIANPFQNGQMTEEADPFAYPEVKLTSYLGEDKITDIRIDRYSYANGKYGKSNVGTVHCKPKDNVSTVYLDPIQQLSLLDFSGNVVKNSWCFS